MKFTSFRRSCAPAAVAAAAVALCGLSAAPAMLTPATAAAQPAQGATKCDPGDIKTVSGKKYVCDKYGHWIHVVSILAVGTFPSAPATGVTVLRGLKQRETNNGGGAAVTCAPGGKPGDYMETRSYIYRNGQRVGFTTTTSICGKDGNWHTVATIVAGTGVGTVSAVGTTTVQVVRP